MKTVLYFDWTRNKKKYILNIVVPVVILAVLFVISVIVDKFFPVVNYRYMRWPDMVKNLFSLPAWNRCLYGNIWQVFSLFYPFFMVYTVMSGLAGAIIEEERLETVVYLKNLSIERNVLMLTKGFLWIVQSLVICLALMLENLLFFLLLQVGQMAVSVLKYYTGLFLVSLIYMAIALFLASFSKRERVCEDKIFAILVIPFLLARIYAVVGFMGELLVATNREGNVTDIIGMISEKLKVLTVVSPLVWSWPDIQINGLYVFCGIAVAIIMTVAAYSIYTHEKVIYRNR